MAAVFLWRGGIVAGGIYATGELPDFPGVPSWIFEIIKALGIAGIALAMWYLERKERMDRETAWQERYDALVTRIEKVTNDAIAVSQRVLDFLNTARRQR